MKSIYPIALVILLAGCKADPPGSFPHSELTDLIFHYSVLKAMDNGVLEGTMTVGELKQRGNMGLGTYNGLDGELIALDGTIYQLKADGSILIAGDEQLIPYAVVSFYTEDQQFELEGEINYPILKSRVEERIPSANLFYAFRIRGKFEYIRVGGAEMQVRPYDESIAQMLRDRPIFEGENVTGTLVGFWCPEYIGDINTGGFHLHFLADDHSLGGHLLEFRAGSLQIGYDIKRNYTFVLPETDDFMEAEFRADKVEY